MEIDFNLGGAANTVGIGTFALAGVALQYEIVPRTTFMAETFRDAPGRGKYQVGARYAVVPARFETYISYGNRYAGSPSDWWVTAGIRLNTPALLR